MGNAPPFFRSDVVCPCSLQLLWNTAWKQLPVLKRTLGAPLFQEQLLRIGMTVANFSGAEAEELRRTVGMRRSWERMKNLEVKLQAGMTANGLTKKRRIGSSRTSVRLLCTDSRNPRS
jgi:hypothetical protein